MTNRAVGLFATAWAALGLPGAVSAQQWQPEGPAAKHGMACCYDPVRQVTVVFGGRTWTGASVANHGTTWEWDGSGWTQRESAVAPTGQLGAGMAYDPVRGVCRTATSLA